MSITEIKQEISNTLFDNVTGEITPESVKDLLLDMVDNTVYNIDTSVFIQNINSLI